MCFPITETLTYGAGALSIYGSLTKQPVLSLAGLAGLAWIALKGQETNQVFLEIERKVQRDMGASYPGPLDEQGNYPWMYTAERFY